jgi:hypothetical protein
MKASDEVNLIDGLEFKTRSLNKIKVRDDHDFVEE